MHNNTPAIAPQDNRQQWQKTRWFISISSSCFVQTKGHLPVVEEDKVLAFVRDESLEVRAHDAVPCGPILYFKL